MEDMLKKIAKHISNARSLRIKAMFSCEVIHASMPKKLGGSQAGSRVLQQLHTLLVQGLIVRTVHEHSLILTIEIS